MSHKSELIAADIEQYLKAHEGKSLLRFMTCGSVDDGKSTLIGRLLFDTKTILADTLTAIERTSQKRHIFRRLRITVMHLGRPEGIRSQFNVWTYLIEKTIDRDRNGLAPLIAGLARRLPHGRISDRRKTGAADITGGHATDVFGVAESNIHCSDDIVHVRLQ